MEQMTDPSFGGRCLCGGVSFLLQSSLRPVIYCHCEQCRRTSGHFVAASAVDTDGLTLVDDSTLQWYRSSQGAQRGFCNQCGSSLFWKPDHGRYISIMAGCIDQPTGLVAKEHIYVEWPGDYYTIEDGLPQFATDNPLDE